jgi:hypothetical protein
VAQIYNFILRQRKEEAIDYVRKNPEILRVRTLLPYQLCY